MSSVNVRRLFFHSILSPAGSGAPLCPFLEQTPLHPVRPSRWAYGEPFAIALESSRSESLRSATNVIESPLHKA
jgi:hypothetical protein